MKARTSLQAAKFSCLAAIAVGAVWGTQSASAVSVGFTLTLTELSSTNLTAQYNGTGGDAAFMVTPNGIDTWTVSLTAAGQGITFNNFVFDWTEPENPNEVNEVSHGTALGNSNNLYVTSDESTLEYQGGFLVTFPNNTSSFPNSAGTDPMGTTPIFIKFNDLAQGAEAGSVPDRASTFVLLSLSLAGLLGLRRFRICQPA